MFSELSSSSSLKSPTDRYFRKAKVFSDFRFEDRITTSERIFMSGFFGMVAYNVLKSKVEIDLAFFLTLILFSLVAIGKEFCTTPNFVQPI